MLKKIELDREIRDILSAEIPEILIKEKPKSDGLKYITGNTVIDILNKAFNYNWNWEIVKCWKEECEPKFNPKFDKEPQPQKPVAHVIGKLTVRMEKDGGGFMEISKTAAGNKAIVGGQNEQKDMYKSASTDALKKAASMLGIGLQLYRDEDEQQFFNELIYEDPWTDEMLEEHNDDFVYIKGLISDGIVTRDELNEIVNDWSGNMYSEVNELAPMDLSNFCDFLREQADAG